MSEKEKLRQQIRTTARQIDPATFRSWDETLSERCLALPQFASARTVMLYCSMAMEAGTWSLIRAALSDGKRVALPICRDDNTMEIGEITSLSEVIERQFPGFVLTEPRAECKILQPNEPDLIIVPGMAFDTQCHRLGRGKGYYDRFLAKTNPSAFKLGLAYDFQLLPTIPYDEHDVSLDAVLSVSRLITQ